jgi:hypothetical protein
MKPILAMILFILAGQSFAEVSCNQLIESNINQKAQNTLVGIGDVSIQKEADGYQVIYQIDGLRFKTTGSSMSLNTGCKARDEYMNECVEDETSLTLLKNFNDENQNSVSGVYRKDRKELRITHVKDDNGNRVIVSDVLLGCRLN